MTRLNISAIVLRFLGVVALGSALLGCSEIPLPLPFSGSPTRANQLTYDAPVSFTIKAGSVLTGTTIAYNGKTDTGAAKIVLSGLVAPKQVADTVDWEGNPVPGASLRLNTRVAGFDEQGLTLIGGSHLEISNVKVQPGGSAGSAMMEFNSPITFSLKKNELVPGSILAFVGSTSSGAQFLGVEGLPYRKQFDSLQYAGRLSPKVFLRLDLRVLSYSEDGAVVGGTANIKLEQ